MICERETTVDESVATRDPAAIPRVAAVAAVAAHQATRAVTVQG